MIPGRPARVPVTFGTQLIQVRPSTVKRIVLCLSGFIKNFFQDTQVGILFKRDPLKPEGSAVIPSKQAKLSGLSWTQETLEEHGPYAGQRRFGYGT